MSWLLTAILCALLVELALRLPFSSVLADVRRTVPKAAHTLLKSRASDHWKEKAVMAYAGTMFAASLKLAVFLANLLSAALALSYGFDRIIPGYVEFILGWIGIGLSFALACAYLALRRYLGHVRL